MNKIEQTTPEEIEGMSKEDLFILLKNYGVIVRKDIMDYEEDKLREAAMALKSKSDENIKKLQEAGQPSDPFPNLSPEEKEDPVSAMAKMGYSDRKHILLDIQALKSHKAVLDQRMKDVDEIEAKISAREAKLDGKESQIEKKAQQLAEDYKKNKEIFGRIKGAKS